MLSTVQKFVGITFVYNFGYALTRVPFVLFFLGKGLDLLQVNILVALLFGVLFLFELPTGLFADRISRKKSVVAAFALVGTAYVGYIFAVDFWQILLVGLAEALGLAFMNGAFHAWLYDQLKFEGREDLQKLAYSREEQMFYAANIAGALIGPQLAQINAIYPWIGTAAICLILSVATHFILHETYGKPAIKPTIGAGWRQMKSVRILQYVLIVAFLQLFATVAPDFQWQPYFKGLGMSQIQLGYLLAGCFVMGFVGSKIAEKSRFKETSLVYVLMTLQIVLGVGIVLASMPLLAVAVVALFLQEIVRGVFIPTQIYFLQRNISDSGQRATVASMSSMASDLGAIVGLILSGVMANNFGIPVAWRFTGLIVVGATLLAFVYFKNGKRLAN